MVPHTNYVSCCCDSETSDVKNYNIYFLGEKYDRIFGYFKSSKKIFNKFKGVAIQQLLLPRTVRELSV
jgi:hypothetical protein